ncbi:MAG: hypothetical protein R3Y32_01650 [Bacillota bacterium]
MTYVEALINFSEKPEDITIYEKQFGKDAEKIIEKAKIINRVKANPRNISKAVNNNNMEYPVSSKVILGILGYIDDLEDEYSKKFPVRDDYNFAFNDYFSEPNYEEESFSYEEVIIYPDGVTENQLFDKLRTSAIWKMMEERINCSYMTKANYEKVQRNTIRGLMEGYGSPIITNRDYIMAFVTFLPDSVWWIDHIIIAYMYIYGCTVKTWHLIKKNDHYKTADIKCSPIELFDKLQEDGEYFGYTTRQRYFLKDCISWMKETDDYYKNYSEKTLMSRIRQVSHMFIEDVFLPSDISDVDSYLGQHSKKAKKFDSQNFVKLINLQAYKRNVPLFKGEGDIRKFIKDYRIRQKKRLKRKRENYENIFNQHASGEEKKQYEATKNRADKDEILCSFVKEHKKNKLP